MGRMMSHGRCLPFLILPSVHRWEMAWGHTGSPSCWAVKLVWICAAIPSDRVGHWPLAHNTTDYPDAVMWIWCDVRPTWPQTMQSYSSAQRNYRINSNCNSLVCWVTGIVTVAGRWSSAFALVAAASAPADEKTHEKRLIHPGSSEARHEPDTHVIFIQFSHVEEFETGARFRYALVVRFG